MRNGGLIYYSINIPITTNGTGAGDIRYTLPFPYDTTKLMGGAVGTEIALTGKGLTGLMTSSVVSVKYADGGYPGANGASLQINGWYSPQ
jgi:hypothetical protein